MGNTVETQKLNPSLTRRVGIVANSQLQNSRLETTWQNRLTGRTLFNPRLTYEFMDTALDQGAVIKATRFSHVFTLEAFHSHYGDRVHPLFLLDGSRIQVLAADSKINPRAGQLVVSLILPKQTPFPEVPLPLQTNFEESLGESIVEL